MRDRRAREGVVSGMMRRLRPVLLGLLLAPLACDDPFSSRDEVELIVMERLTQCTAWFAPETYPCLSVIELPGEEPRSFYDDIEGFEFEEGVRQRILVARYTLKNPPADASSYEYRLLQVISRQRIYVPVIPLAPLSAQTAD